ncbi:hypothetical protein [Actinoallomurus sp. NPDC052274]|uniref:hypothetical protein n=1 Tax=Actinoallomurus sp. NPDC052274 TaxID=3155420 RepID=UPI0034194CF3
MTITISIPQLALSTGLADALRSLLPFLEPVAVAIVGACGAGILAQIGLDIGLRLIQSTLQA